MLIDATFLIGFSLLLLRIIIAIIFFSSGKNHILNAEERADSIGMSTKSTKVLGIIEVIAAVSLALGIFTQIGAIIVILIMLGAIYKKTVEWKTEFFAEEGYGWHYDVFLLAGSLVILATSGGYLTFY
ncbi:DoxX family protein [Cochleicola gelatinilyticus]|uniref:DoxX family protein n=1 Tax=Cochleicola gelatinilyticus TaxID=1763537 RepID=A0A167J8E9_9FLAO|nr:DoxX family protein [Cochleicola gelatinilyticus]OAB80425.1 hypothetical protein ULVI_06730 [Cochleicola gelatinilyticus]